MFWAPDQVKNSALQSFGNLCGAGCFGQTPAESRNSVKVQLFISDKTSLVKKRQEKAGDEFNSSLLTSSSNTRAALNREHV